MELPTQCPFTWDFERDLQSCAIGYAETMNTRNTIILEARAEEEECVRKTFGKSLFYRIVSKCALIYEYVAGGYEDKTEWIKTELSLIKEAILCAKNGDDQQNDTVVASIKDALIHVMSGIEIYACKRLRINSSEYEMVFDDALSWEKMGDAQKSAVLAFKAEFYARYGANGAEKSIDIWDLVLASDDRAYWYYLRGRASATMRIYLYNNRSHCRKCNEFERRLLSRLQLSDEVKANWELLECATCVEMDDFNKALSMEPTNLIFNFEVFVMLLAKLKNLLHSKMMKEVSELARYLEGLLRMLIEARGNDADALLLVAEMLFNFPKKKRKAGLIENYLNKALEIDPNNVRIPHLMGRFKECCDKDFNSALKYYERALENDKSEIKVEFCILRVKYRLDPEMDVIAFLTRVLSSIPEWKKNTKIRCLCHMTDYYIFIKNDVGSAIDCCFEISKLGRELIYMNKAIFSAIRFYWTNVPLLDILISKVKLLHNAEGELKEKIQRFIRLLNENSIKFEFYFFTSPLESAFPWSVEMGENSESEFDAEITNHVEGGVAGATDNVEVRRIETKKNENKNSEAEEEEEEAKICLWIPDLDIHSEFLLRTIVLKVLFVYDCEDRKEVSEGLAFLKEIALKILSGSQSDSSVIGIEDAIVYILYEVEAYARAKLQLDDEPFFEKRVPLEEMNNRQKAGLFGFQAMFCLGIFGYAASMFFFEQAIEMDSENSIWHYHLGSFMNAYNKYHNDFQTAPTKKVTEELEIALSLEPENCAYIVQMAIIWLEYVKALCRSDYNRKEEDNYYESAIKLFRQAVALNKRDARVFYTCAKGFFYLPKKFQDLDCVKFCLHKALELDAKDVRALHFMGLYQERILRNENLALDYYVKALNVNEFMEQAYLAVIRLNYDKDATFEVIPSLERFYNAIQSYDRRRRCRVLCYMMSYYIFEKDDLESAVDCYFRILKIEESVKIVSKKKLNVNEMVSGFFFYHPLKYLPLLNILAVELEIRRQGARGEENEKFHAFFRALRDQGVEVPQYVRSLRSRILEEKQPFSSPFDVKRDQRTHCRNWRIRSELGGGDDQEEDGRDVTGSDNGVQRSKFPWGVGRNNRDKEEVKHWVKETETHWDCLFRIIVTRVAAIYDSNDKVKVFSELSAIKRGILSVKNGAEYDLSVSGIEDAVLSVMHDVECFMKEALQLKGNPIFDTFIPWDDMNDGEKSAVLAFHALFSIETECLRGHEKSLVIWKRAIALDARRAYWHYFLGFAMNTLRKRKNYISTPGDKELEELEKALILAPRDSAIIVKNASVLKEKAIFLMGQGRLNESKAIMGSVSDLFHRAVECNEKDARVFGLCAGGFYYMPGKFRDLIAAKFFLDKSLELNPNDARNVHLMGVYQERILKDKDAALTYYERALSLEEFMEKPYIAVIRLKYQRDAEFDVISSLERLFQHVGSWDRRRKSHVLCYMMSYYIFEKDEVRFLEKAVDCYFRILDIGAKIDVNRAISGLFFHHKKHLPLLDALSVEIKIRGLEREGKFGEFLESLENPVKIPWNGSLRNAILREKKPLWNDVEGETVKKRHQDGGRNEGLFLRRNDKNDGFQNKNEGFQSRSNREQFPKRNWRNDCSNPNAGTNLHRNGQENRFENWRNQRVDREGNWSCFRRQGRKNQDWKGKGNGGQTS